MLRTPLAKIVNRTPSGERTSPFSAQDTTPFVSKPKVARSPLTTSTCEKLTNIKHMPITTISSNVENISDITPIVTTVTTHISSETHLNTEIQENGSLSSLQTTTAEYNHSQFNQSSCVPAPIFVNSVIKIQPPTPMTESVMMTARKTVGIGLPMLATPMTTPSRRLAPHEFQEYVKHFRSPVDKFVSNIIIYIMKMY